MKRTLSAAAVFTAFAAVSGVHAQEPGSPAAKDGALPDVMVTAERRSADAQRTPLSITALAGASIDQQGVVNAYQLSRIVPGFKAAAVGATAFFNVRGVGSTVNSLGEGAVSWNVDGVAIASPIGVNGAFYDLDRVEVLKGPQGTLYGRNAAAGAVNLVSAEPTFDFSGGAGLEIGDYNLVRANLLLNAPVSETLAMRGAFQSTKRDGYLGLDYSDADEKAGRVRLSYQPNGAFRALVTANIYAAGGHGPHDVPLKGVGGTFLNPTNPWQLLEGPADLGVTVPANAYQDILTWGVSANLNWALDFADLTVIPAYNDVDYRALSYSGGLRQDIDSIARQKSLETRLASKGGGPLNWLVGAYYLYERQDYSLDVATSPAQALINGVRHETTSLAVFGQAVYGVTDKLRLTAGLRYTHEEKDQNGINRLLSLPSRTQTLTYPSLGQDSWNAVNYRISAEYDAAARSMLYASISTGFKSGGFYAGLAPNSYRPETLTAYAIGAKNRFLDNRLQMNLETFYWVYKDLQTPQFGFVNPGGVIAFVTYNAKEARSYGAELQADFLATPNDRLTLNVQYLVARYEHFLAPGFAPLGIPATSYDGQDLSFAPPWSLTAGYSRTFDLTSGAQIIPSVYVQHESHSYIILQRRPGALRPSYVMTDADVRYVAPGGRWEASLWVRNIEDAAVLSRAGVNGAGLWGSPRPPRTFGLAVRASF